MDKNDTLSRLGVYSRRAPRYTSYPTAAQFTDDLVEGFARKQLAELPASKPVSVYLHIPFCERLCWFCACRTQGTKTHGPVADYLESLKRELGQIGKTVPSRLRMSRMHWGGGSPTILAPAMVQPLADAVFDAVPRADDFEFSVEIDPTLVDAKKILALSGAGMTRASIGVQDFAPEVQKAIGRDQSVAQTQSCVTLLRDHGLVSLNMDILYGLPHQTLKSVRETVDHVLALDPDRIALYGYAHVPWMAKRQQLIDEEVLPNGPERRALFAQMSEQLRAGGMVPIGIDHFAKPTDSLSIAAKTGNLRRNFQGYTTDICDTLIGAGASSISKLPGGYAQNAASSSRYMQMIANNGLATQRGVTLTNEDKMRARAIEMIMCDFELNLRTLEAEFPGAGARLEKPLAAIREAYAEATSFSDKGFVITDHKRALARLVAVELDEYTDSRGRFSMVS